MNEYGRRLPLWEAASADTPTGLPLSEGLLAELVAWARVFDEHFTWDSGWDDEEIATQHRAAALVLRDQVQAELGDDFEVVPQLWEHDVRGPDAPS